MTDAIVAAPVDRIPNKAMRAIIKCELSMAERTVPPSCQDCQAADYCTPDCLVRVAKQLMQTLQNVDASIRSYRTLGGDPDMTIEQIINTIRGADR